MMGSGRVTKVWHFFCSSSATVLQARSARSGALILVGLSQDPELHELCTAYVLSR